MAKNTYLGIGDSAKKVKKPFIGVDNTAKKITRAYIGVDGKAKRGFDLRTISVLKRSISVDGPHAAAYGNGVYVVFDLLGYYLRSTNGQDWNKTSYSALEANYLGLCYGGGFFAGFSQLEGGYPYALRSADGSNWSRNRISTDTGYLRSICYGNGRYVAVGVYSDGYAAVYTSIDGLNYSLAYKSDSIKGRVANVCYLPEVGFSAGQLFSPDGVNWADVPDGPNHSADVYMCVGRHGFVCVVGAASYISEDGLIWKRNSLNVGFFPHVTYLNGVYIASYVGSYHYYSYDAVHFESLGLDGFSTVSMMNDGKSVYLFADQKYEYAVIEFTEP